MNKKSFNFDEFLFDIAGLVTCTADEGTLSGVTNKGLSVIAVSMDGAKAMSNFLKGNTVAGIDSSVDFVVDVIGCIGPEGACLSIGFKYTKKGLVFGTKQMARAQIELEKYVVNKWTYALFGVTFR